MWTLPALLALAATARSQSPTPNTGGAPNPEPTPNTGGSPNEGPVSPGAPIITIGGSSYDGSFVGGSTITADANGRYSIGQQTLQPGSAVTYQGTIYSLPPGGMVLVAGGQTSSIERGEGSRRPNFATGATSSSAAAGGGSASGSSSSYGALGSSSSYGPLISSSSYGPSVSSAAMTGSGSAYSSQATSAVVQGSSAAPAGVSASSAAPSTGDAAGSPRPQAKGSVFWSTLAIVVAWRAW